MLKTTDFNTGKMFVLLKSNEDVLLFTNNPLGDNIYRTAALQSRVIVFLETIGRIWAMGRYYSIAESDFNDLQTLYNTLNTTVGELITSLGNLETTVSRHDTNIGNVSVVDDENPENNVEGSGLLGDVERLIGDITEIKSQIGALVGNEEGLAAAVETIVNNELNQILPSYVTLETYNAEMQTKVDAADFEDFSATVTEKLNTVEAGVGTNEAAISALQSLVSEIPKFAITIVTELPTLKIYENEIETSEWNIESQSNPNGFSLTTIYLKRRTGEGADVGDNEIFTEYIYVKDGNEYKIEKLGSQTFQITNYLTVDATNEAIQEAIQNAVGEAINDPTVAADSDWYTTLKAGIATNANNITNNTNAILELQNLLTKLDENQQRILKLTGEDILTHPLVNTTIASDIDNLYQKIEWEIINEESDNNEP